MLAVHFGAGNIGRGFIGLLLNQAGYHTTFVDVNETIINEINEKKEYQVILASENKETVTVTDISGINSVTSPEQVIEAIAKADLITTAVGPNILKIISELIAKGLSERAKSNSEPLNLIACENMIGGSTLLKESVYQHITDEEKSIFDERFAFPDAAVDRIVPNQKNEELLQVSVEPYFEWVVDESKIKGKKPEIKGITYVSDLKPYIERKLFTVNTGHAAVAYVGHYMGYGTIDEAMQDKKVQDIIQGALTESGEALIQTYKFDRSEHQEYIKKIIDRFRNPYISDEVTRVGRGPIRKLGPQDRLIKPAKMYLETTGKEPVYLAKVIAAALEYRHEEEEAKKLEQLVKDNGYEVALQSIAELDADDPLIQIVKKEIEEMKEWKK